MKDSLFENLAKELSSEERRTMLERIRTNLPESGASLHEEEVSQPVDLEHIYKNASWFEKLIIFVLHLLSSKEILEVTEERQIKLLLRNMRKEAGNWISLDQKRLRQDFYLKLDNLKKLCQVFKEPLEMLLVEKEEFILFLGNSFFKEIYQVMQDDTNPDEILKENPDFAVSRIREKIQYRFDKAFDTITLEMRKLFKTQARSLYQMNALAQYPFHKFQALFQERGESGVEAPWENCRSSLAPLNDILQSFLLFPDNQLLEQLLIFYYRDRIIGTSNEDLAELLGERYKEASQLKNALIDITSLPLNNLLKLITGNINYYYSDIGGGEDFFPIYKKSWQRKIEQRISNFSIRMQIEELRNNLLNTWSGDRISPLGRYNASFSSYRKFRYVNSIELLKAYYEELKVERGYPCMEIIWKRGEFYKKNNQEQYYQVMEFIQGASEIFNDFIKRLEVTGYYGKQLADLEKEKGGILEGDEKKLIFLYDTIDQDAHILVTQMLKNLKLLGKLLSGILIGDRGEYDTLSNYADLSAPPNRQFKDELVTREFQVNNSCRNITDLFALEEKALSVN